MSELKRLLSFTFAFFLLVLFSSCAATVPVKKDPQVAPATLRQELAAAEASFKTNDRRKWNDANSRLKKLVQQSPESDVAGEANFLLGQQAEKTNQNREALGYYSAIAKSPVSSPRESEARIRGARIALKLSFPQEAEQLVSRNVRYNNLTPEQEVALEKLRAESALALKKNREALEALAILSEKSPPTERDRFRQQAQEILETGLTEAELRDFADRTSSGSLAGAAKFRYGLILADQRNYSRARGYFADAASASPGTQLAERAQLLVNQIDSRNRVETKTIGVVLPLTGRNSAIGYKALRGIQLGIGVYGRAPSNFKLAVIDSEGNPDGARRAIERLVQEDSVIAVIGGLLSRTVSAEASKAQELGVPAIMLSQKAGVTQAGGFVFRSALTSQMQVQYLVDLAMGKLGYKNFAVMYPNDAYGIEFTNLFWDEVRSRGGKVAGAQVYDPQEADFRGHVQRLVGTFYVDDRADEYRLRAKAWTEKNPRRSSRQAAPSFEDLVPPAIGFDAVFIPDSARAVGQIAPMLAYNNVNRVPLIGTNLWNSPSLISRGQKFVDGAIFADSFLPSNPAVQNSEFFSTYKATFEEEPGLTEMQSYDAALILRQLISSGESSRTGLRDRMASLRDFPGAIGTLSANADREFMRPLTALTVKDGRIVDLQAPRK